MLARALVLLTVVLLAAGPALGAWPETWRSLTGAGDPGKGRASITSNGRAYLSVPAAAADGDTSATIKISSPEGAYLCLDTDVATLDASGALTMDVMFAVGVDGTVEEAVIIASLSSAVPCVFDIPPGMIFLDVTTSAGAEVGQIRLQGHAGSLF